MTHDEMRAEADRLTELQREHRGFTRGKDLDGKPCLVLGPYVPTEETEARAAQIVNLRRTAARLRHPIVRPVEHV